MWSGGAELRATVGRRLGETHGPFLELSRHFLGRLLRPPFLTEVAADSLRTVLSGIAAGALALGMFLPRMFVPRYRALTELPVPDPYRVAFVADEIFMISVVMLLSGLAIVTIAHALFPDEIDFILISPLPVTREYIFAANLAAVGFVLGVFTVASVALMGISFPIVSDGRWAAHSIPVHVPRHLAASAAASVFVYATVLALQGVIAIAAPRRMIRVFSLVAQSVLAFGLIASLPIISSIPWLGAAIEANPEAVLLAPPAWFAGAERWILGSDRPLDAQLAQRAAAGLGVAFVIALASYSIAYRRFDRALSRAASPARQRARNRRWRVTSLLGEPSGILVFAGVTIARSRMHQLVVFGVMACGVALVLNGMMAALAGRWFDAGTVSPFLLQRAAMSMPLILTFTSVLALRAAFRLPVDLRANWIFRIAEDPAFRTSQIDAVERAFVLYALLPSLAVTLPVQLIVFGASRAVMALSAATLLGALLIQIVMQDWRRIPFTCTYLPGRRLFAFTAAIFFGAFVTFVSFGGGMVAWGSTHPSRFVLTFGVLLTAFSWLRRRRLRARGVAPMEFDDEPEAAIRLGLSG
jgi:hypothetical protein